MTNMHVLRKMMAEQYTEAHFEAILQMIDRLHDAAALEDVQSVSLMDKRTIIGWLDDIIFTAEETIRELQESRETVNELQGWSKN